MTDMTGRPPPIRTDQSNAFANNTMRVRLPAIIDETINLNSDYPSDVTERLRRLRNEIASGARIDDMELCPAGDEEAWSSALQSQRDIVGGEPPRRPRCLCVPKPPVRRKRRLSCPEPPLLPLRDPTPPARMRPIRSRRSRSPARPRWAPGVVSPSRPDAGCGTPTLRAPTARCLRREGGYREFGTWRRRVAAGAIAGVHDSPITAASRHGDGRGGSLSRPGPQSFPNPRSHQERRAISQPDR